VFMFVLNAFDAFTGFVHAWLDSIFVGQSHCSMASCHTHVNAIYAGIERFLLVYLHQLCITVDMLIDQLSCWATSCQWCLSWYWMLFDSLFGCFGPALLGNVFIDQSHCSATASHAHANVVYDTMECSFLINVLVWLISPRISA
jgi:hypothetical protein